MVIIKLRNGLDWYNANWVYRQLAEDVISAFPDDKDLKLTLEKGQAFGMLSLDNAEPSSAEAVINAIKKVARDIAQGRISGWKGKKLADAKGQSMYLEAISELLDLIRRFEEEKV